MRIQGYLVLFGVTVALAALVLTPRWVKLSQQRARVEVLAAEVASIQTDIASLKIQCERMDRDPELVERFARERMGWRRPGEVVFK